MEKRFLGHSGLEVSVLGFGAMTFGPPDGPMQAYGTTELHEAQTQIDIALDHGVTFFDSSDNYSEGRSETILGEVIAKRRNDIVIATKAYGRVGPGDHDIGLSRRHILKACDDSLRRLKTDWIDLYQVHNYDGRVPLEETLKALDDLVRVGKVRYIGCSNHFAWQLTKALGTSQTLNLERYISQQIQYSLLVRDAEVELIPAAVDQGVGTIVYSPLAQGYLSGKFTSQVTTSSRLGAQKKQLEKIDTPRAQAIVTALVDIARAHPGATASQVALNWLKNRPSISTVLIGARTTDQLIDNLAAATWQLKDADIARLDDLSTLQPTEPRVSYPMNAQRLFHPERNPKIFNTLIRS